jgi:uncharacterized protein
MAPRGDDQGEVIEFLSRGAAYGWPGAPVTRIDTHASVVFLAGDRAYKLKRAIKFSYLDYSSIAKREAMCRAEYDLNRRTAPELYLGVHKVTRAPGGALALDGDGPAIDWLLAMKQFPQDALFDRLAERHELTPILMRDLADEIAAFHAKAEPYDGNWTTAMRGIAAENLANMRRTDDALDQDKVAELSTRTAAALARLAPALSARTMRRCHGDLHLRNIALIDGKPVLFDGIEFNDAFICIDPLYDLAFLLMDLDHRDLGTLANLVFNRYLDRTGDEAGLPLLPLYLSIRAGVRAHVSIAALARQKSETEKHDLALAAARYLEAALAFLEPARPRLVATGGFSGTGKSTIAQGLAPGFPPKPGARVLRSDVIRKRLFGIAPETRLPPPAYDKATNERVYRAMYDEAEAALRAGYTAIADAAFLDPAERAAIAAVAMRAGVTFSGLWLDAPAQTLHRRIAARRGDASDADRAVLDFQLSRDLGPLDWARIDASGSIKSVTDDARRYLFSASVPLDSAR